MTNSNRGALAAVRARAGVDRQQRLWRIERALAGTGVEGRQLLSEIARQGALTLNFHPDRLLGDGRSVAQALYEDGVYRSQFETGISNGGLTAYPGGDRDVWEDALFGGCYQAAGVGAGERASEVRPGEPHESSQRCLSAVWVLPFAPASIGARARATVLYGDSADGSTEVGTVDACEPVLAPLLEDLVAGRGALGRAGVTLREFVDGVVGRDIEAGRGRFARLSESS
jgi:hypothetical protein